MANVLTIDEILSESKRIFQRVTDQCLQIPDETFFYQPEDKWSIAQNLQHLIISTKTTTAAFALPKFLVRLIAGKPNRHSRSYDELLNKYQQKLAQGGKASGRYIPRPLKASTGKERILISWNKATDNYLQAIKKNWNDAQPDQYIAPHPLLGKITLRELCYFTIFHTEHHLNIIREREKKI